MKKKIISLLIFVAVGQLIAYLICHFFKENYFIPMVFASLIGFYFGYRKTQINKSKPLI